MVAVSSYFTWSKTLRDSLKYVTKRKKNIIKKSPTRLRELTLFNFHRDIDLVLIQLMGSQRVKHQIEKSTNSR